MAISPSALSGIQTDDARSGNRAYAVLERLPEINRTHLLCRAGFGSVRNVGNIVGTDYATFDGGLQGLYGLMVRHITGNHANWRGDPRTTIAGIAPRYCMTKTQQWIENVSRISGIDKDERLSVHNKEQMMAFVAAVVAVERGSNAVVGHAFSRATLERNYTAALDIQSQRFASIRASAPQNVA